MTRAAGRSLLGISTPLAITYDVALLDLDGVVYVGPDPIPTAAPALAKARAAGMRLAFVTNNASRDPAAVAAHLVALGVPAEAAEVVTSSQAAATVLAERLGIGASVLVIVLLLALAFAPFLFPGTKSLAAASRICCAASESSWQT